MKNAFYIQLFQPLITGIVVLFSVFTSYGQLYPVQATVVTTPPYYNYMAYYGDQNNHLQVIATFTDFASPPIMARLRFTIEGAGFTLRTRQDIPVGTPFTLSPGVPVFMQGSDLLPYLSQNNLELVSGNVDFENLPEGFTTICVEVVKDGVASEIVSNNACTAFFLQYMQPPQAFLPLCNSVVDTAAMFQTFQWSPPQNYIPSVGSDLSYTFSLYEWIDTTNYNIFQSGQGLVYQTQTSFPMVQVSNFDVLWQQGRKYVWRVQAQLTSNGIPVQMFTQNGLSAPCSFYYGHQVSLAETLSSGLSINVSAEALASRKGRAMWTVTDETPGEGLSTYSSYIVEYRRKPYEGENYLYQWLYDTVVANQLPIWRLEPEETYQVRVRGIAGDYVSDPSEMAEFTTPPLREYACGEADLPYVPANYTPLAVAQMGDIFQIGQFELEVTHIDPLQLPGHFQGRGLIKHGFIGGAKVKVRFDDLLVDNAYMVREGQAVAVTSGVDNWLNEEYLNQVVPDTVNGVIESGGYLNDSTVFVVVNGDSLFFNFDGSDLPIVIHGDNNVEYQFWPNGTLIVTTYGIIASNDDLDGTAQLHILFEQAPGQAGGFDKKQYPQFNDNYEIIVCQDQYQYFVSNASKSTTGTSQVKAIIHGTIPSFLPSQLTFELAGGNTQVPYSQLNDSTFLLTLPARSYDYMVYAIYADFKLGKLNVKSYTPVTKKVRIVPIVAMSITEAQIETELNQIYKGANLTIDATIAPQFNTPEFTASTEFANPDVSLMSKYTAQMRALRDAYLAENEVESGTYLVFIIPEFADPAIDGYMVRGRGLGFVAQSTLTNAPTFAHTLGHELGHGIGGLKHAWGETESLKGGTNNLMDYSSGTQLIKKQWEGLRNPAAVLSFLDGEEDGSNYTVSGGDLSAIYSSFPNADGTISFIDPSGRIITLPQGLKSITFASPDSYWTTAQGNHVSENETPIGALISFKLANNDFYYASNSVSHHKFRGYERESDEQLYPNNTTPIASINHALAGIPCIVNGNVKFKICPMNKDAILANGTDPAPVGGYLIPEEKFKFLNDYITATSDAQGQIVVATFTTQLSNQVLQYLQSVRADVIGREAVYAFEVAYLLEANDIVGKCIGALTNSVQLSIQSEYENQVIIEEQANFNEFNTQVSDNTAISVSTNMPPMNIYSLDLDPQIFHPTVNYGQDPDYFKKYYYTLVNWLYKINKQADYTHDALTGESIDIGAFGDFIYDQLRVDQRECYLASLTASQRVKILREYSEWTWGSEKERLILEVLETTPEDQYSYLLTVFEENNYSLLKGLNGDLWNGDNYRLFMNVSKMVMKVKESEISDMKSLYASSIGPIGQSNYETMPDVIILQKSRDEGDIRIEVTTTWTSAGTIKVFTDNDFPGINVENTTRYYDPYEIVIVHFEDNYQFANMNGNHIEVGDRIAVPAMFAYWLVEEQEKIEETVAIRVIIDLGAIAVSIATVNPGPFLIADAAIAAVDLVFAINEDYILSEGTAQQKELLGNWNTFAAVVGAVNGVYLVQKVTAGALRFSYNPALLKQQFQNWKTSNLLKLEDAKEALKKIYKNTKSFFFSNSSFSTFKTEISALMREAEVNRLMIDQPSSAGTLSISTTGGQNQLRISNSEIGSSPLDLCYIDPDDQGRMVLSAIQFMDNNPTQINKVLMVLDDVNFKNASGELILGKKLFVIKTSAGAIKCYAGEILLANYPKVRSYLIDNQVMGGLNNSKKLIFENALKTADIAVLNLLENLPSSDDFAEIVRGFKDNEQAFINASKSLDAFSISNNGGWLQFWKLTPKMENALTTLRNELNGNLLPTGNATEIQLASIHAFTVNGDFVNIPMRYNPTWFGEYNTRALNHIKSGLNELRNVPQRKVVNEIVYSGKMYSAEDFNALFVGKIGVEIPFSGFVSSSKLESVALGFTKLSEQWAGSGSKIGVIRKITTANGVYIDDLSDWGVNLGQTRHSDKPLAIQIQQEVVMDAGYFRQVSEPIPIIVNGEQLEIEGVPYYYVNFIELLKPLP
ncbi:MAG: fibronectin type III domain-containing protein [Fluviicola sp.]|nr:fibronectin type III domain-containing protein [Fluviicola sp.]